MILDRVKDWKESHQIGQLQVVVNMDPKIEIEITNPSRTFNPGEIVEGRVLTIPTATTIFTGK